MKKVQLKARKDRRVRRGHPWIFSNEVQTWGPEKPEAGEIVEVRDSKGRFLAHGYANRKSLIAIRVLSRHKKNPFDHFELERRIHAALEAREASLDAETDSVRLIFGEGDHLPGLIVDRFGSTLVVQFLTQGIECMREKILELLTEKLSPTCIVERGDNRGRALEGLPTKKHVLLGTPEATQAVSVDGIQFFVDPSEGQKTGFFLDQRPARRKLQSLSKGKKILDVFSYSGAFAAYAAKGGASQIVGVDRSEPALKLAEKTFSENGFAEAEWIQGDAFQVLQGLAQEGRTFDGVILDPPPFAPSKKDVDAARQAHLRLHKLALKVLEPGGFLFTSSCSFHIGMDDLGASAAQAAVQLGRLVQQVDCFFAGEDHPSLPGMPESRYLSSLLLRVI